MTTLITTIIASVFGSTALFSFIQFLISRKDNSKTQLKAVNEHLTTVDKHLEAIDEKIDRNEAQRARTQILRFNDELYMGKMHTKEHFDEILAACDSYNKFCDAHPDFENMRTTKAQKRISEVYDKCAKNHLFLDGNDNKEETK